MKKVIVFGGSGFIGTHLISELRDNYDITIITRRPKSVEKQFNNIKVQRLRRKHISKLTELFNDAKAVINLSGENISKRWTGKQKNKIRNSRLDIDNIIIRSIRGCSNPPEILMQGSSIGIYGLSRNTIDITEDTPVGQRGFISRLALSHEETFEQLESILRVIYIRTGLVLDAKQGVLPKLAKPYNSFFGGKIGSGKQWHSWIHIKDEVRAIKFLLENDEAKGAYNLTSPEPIKQKELANKLSYYLGKPNIFSKPTFFVKIFLGRMADELILNGVRVLPNRLTESGFSFNYKTIDSALANIYKKE